MKPRNSARPAPAPSSSSSSATCACTSRLSTQSYRPNRSDGEAEALDGKPHSEAHACSTQEAAFARVVEVRSGDDCDAELAARLDRETVNALPCNRNQSPGAGPPTAVTSRSRDEKALVILVPPDRNIAETAPCRRIPTRHGSNSAGSRNRAPTPTSRTQSVSNATTVTLTTYTRMTALRCAQGTPVLGD